MKVLCLGYYDKFSRLFIHIENHLKKTNPEAEFRILSSYLSGFLYSKIRFKSSMWMSWNSWKMAKKHKKSYQEKLKNNTIYKGFSVEKLIQPHLKNTSKNKADLAWQSMAYIDILEKEIQKADLILMIGDLRLPFQISKKLAQQNNIPHFHLEQAPFSSTFIDQKGVNANASIRGYQPKDKITETQKEFVQNYLQKSTSKKYWRSPIYRGLDYFLEFSIKKSTFFPPDLKIENPFFTKKKSIQKDEVLNLKKNIFLLIGQVPFDVNLLHHSPLYDDFTEILKDVHKNLPENSLLVVREHPLYKGKYNADFYDYIKKNPTVFLDQSISLNSSIKKANVVVVNNSTVGLEAIVKGKSVLALGNSYYDSSEICLKLDNRKDLQHYLKKSLSYTPSQGKVYDFLFQLINQELVEGFITDKKLIAAKQITQKILNSKS